MSLNCTFCVMIEMTCKCMLVWWWLNERGETLLLSKGECFSSI